MEYEKHSLNEVISPVKNVWQLSVFRQKHILNRKDLKCHRSQIGYMYKVFFAMELLTLICEANEVWWPTFVPKEAHLSWG